MQNKRCVLLINLGSPERPETGAIRRYLRTFLSDPRVMDVPRWVRWLILNLFILPFRPSVIQPKYKKIWDGKQFLLVKHGQELVQALVDELDGEFQIRLAMRYSQPLIPEILKEVESEGFSELIVVPLFPQYASATGGSVIEVVFDTLKSWTVIPTVRVVSQFCDHPGFIQAWEAIARPLLDQKPDHVLFSFHGLPVTHIHKADSSSHCLKSGDCCSTWSEHNSHCYRAQCFQTARSIAELVDIKPDRFTVAFQSRLGKAEWIGPSTTETISNLAAAGKKDLLVFCPSFVADCLETVEEIGVEARDQFIEAGGRELTLVPSLNTEPAWVKALCELITHEK